MTNPKSCIQCGRTIDRYARICPFCNWDQNERVPATPAAQQAAETAYEAPPDRSWRKPVMAAVGAVLLLVVAFFIGSRIHGSAPPATSTTAAEQPSAQPSKPPPRAQVTLVPDNGPMPEADQPITSAPVTQTAEGLPNEYQRADATAVSSNEYAQLAQRAQAEQKTQRGLVDPRAITGPAYGAAPAPRTPQRAATPAPAVPAVPREPAVSRTAAVPEYQPVPDVRIRQNATASLDVIVGPDGRVREVNVRQPIPADMGKLIGTVQRWRFKPATENGVPVESSFRVDISFHANE